MRMSPPYTAATVLYCIFLFILSSDSTPPRLDLPWEIASLDKAVHAVLYAVLAAIVSVGMRRSGKPVTPWAQCFIPILFVAAYGVTDEVHQLFVPNRTFDIGDWLADVSGAALVQAWLCFRYARRDRMAAR